MSTFKQLTGADWFIWSHHLFSAAIKGTAISIKTCYATTAGAAMATQWIDLRVVGYTGLAGFLFAVVEFLAVTPLPTGSEDETT